MPECSILQPYIGEQMVKTSILNYCIFFALLYLELILSIFITGLDKQIFEHKIVIIFLPISLNM